MRWSEIDFAERVWKSPAPGMKKRRAHLVPLSDFALHILHTASKEICHPVYVFASAKTGKPLGVTSASHAFGEERGLTRKLHIADAQIHDFRRTGTTAMTQRLDVPRFVAGKVLSHVRATSRGLRMLPAATTTCTILLPEKTEALVAWSSLLVTILTGPSNVIEMPRRHA